MLYWLCFVMICLDELGGLFRISCLICLVCLVCFWCYLFVVGLLFGFVLLGWVLICLICWVELCLLVWFLLFLFGCLVGFCIRLLLG